MSEVIVNSKGNDTMTNLKKIGKIVLIIALSLLLVFVSIKLYRAIRKPANAQYIQGGGTLPEGWSPTALTDELYSVIDGVFDFNNTKDKAFEKFNALNDNQMIAVYNDWNERYSSKPVLWGMAGTFGTLRQSVYDENAYSSIGGINNRNLMLANLDRLKLK